MNKINSEVGKRITDLRKKRGFSREKLSELADISVQFLAEIEKGRKSMTVNTLRKVSSALMVTTDYIVNGNKDEKGNSELLSLLNTVPASKRQQAEKLLIVFLEAISD